MTTADAVLRVARSQLGVAETRDGSNPYGWAYGMNRVAWCAQFVWWCFREVGASELIHPRTAYTPTLAQWFRDRRQWTAGPPTVGAVVFYNWPDSVNRIQHVGLVETFDDVSITAIEGNTGAANQSDGGQVMRRRRARNTSVVGYGHPAYTTTAALEGFLMALTDAEQREILDGIRKLKPGVVLKGRSPVWGDRVDDQYGWTLNAAAAAVDAAAGIRVVAERLATAGTSAPAQLTDVDVQRIAAAVIAQLGHQLAG